MEPFESNLRKALREPVPPAYLAGKVMARIKESRPGSRYGFLVVATAAVIWVVISLVVFQKPAGTVRTIVSGDTVRAGEHLTVRLPDGSLVEMRSHSEMALEKATDGLLLQLSGGSIIVTAAKQGQGHLYVHTKDATVSVVGTVFLVNAEKEGSRVAVIQGEVQVQHGGQQQNLVPGEQVATNPHMEKRSIKEEIGWSRQAEQHLALLEQLAQSAAPQRAKKPAFEVASVKPAKSPHIPQLDAARYSDAANLEQFIMMAYGLKSCLQKTSSGEECPLLGGTLPAWTKKDWYEIQARLPEGVVLSRSYSPPQLREGDISQLDLMLQGLLEERFHLKVHTEKRELSVWQLTVRRSGFKLKPSDSPVEIMPKRGLDGSDIDLHGRRSIERISNRDLPERRRIVYTHTSMEQFVEDLGGFADRPVVDATGLGGQYDFAIEYDLEGLSASPDSNATPLNPFSGLTCPGLSATLQDVGLKCEITKQSVEVLVIDHVERPSEN